MELATAYSVLPESDDDSDDGSSEGGSGPGSQGAVVAALAASGADNTGAASGHWSRVGPRAAAAVQHVLWPAFRSHLLPPADIASELVQVACLEKLYKVFERC